MTEFASVLMLPPWGMLAAGLVVGGAVGFAVRRARLCTFGAIEDALLGGDGRRLKVFGLALAIALLGTEALILSGLLAPEATSYVPEALPLLAVALGSTLFGLGMALVGTCSFGCLLRLGGGDLRALVVILLFSAAAYALLRGSVADLRIGWLESARVPIAPGRTGDLGTLLEGIADLPLRTGLAMAAAGLLALLAIRDPRLRRSPRLLLGGVVLGLAVVAGWIVTAALSDPFEGPVRPQSLTFVSPLARTLHAGMAEPAALLDFGVGSVLGVVVGAAAFALLADEFRWEAFDDPREMRRHLLGALLMGFGGVLAGGCTIGQGLTAGSLLAASWPVAIAGMILGARLGMAILVEGSLGGLLGRVPILLGAAAARLRRSPAREA